MALTPITATWGELAVGETALGTKGVLAEVALGAPGRFAAFDDLITLTVRAADRDERHGPFLPKRDYEDEAQCDSNLSPSPLLKHYPVPIQRTPHPVVQPVATAPATPKKSGFWSWRRRRG